MARRKSSLAEDLVMLPWWVSLLLAGAALIFLPALLPAPMRGLALIVAFFLLAMAALSALRSLDTRTLLESQTDIDSLRSMSWKQFEDLLGEVYRRKGYEVEETIGGGADGGVDLVLRQNGHITIVQCKRWKETKVPVEVIRELYGVLHDRKASAANLVVTTDFTKEAIAFAEGKPIELVSAEKLLRLISSVQTSRKMTATLPPLAFDLADAPHCPMCKLVMVKRTARRGSHAGKEFWGCSLFPKCRGTRPI